METICKKIAASDMQLTATWWERMDSNHRSEDATDLQSAPFGHSGTLPYSIGAGGRIRTPDLLITNQLLYQLSYTSISAARSISTDFAPQMIAHTAERIKSALL